ncbi:alpha/beta hydrolase family protein [Pseudopedobacter beijingensis]|uniref:Alpha/beta hydrolase family protein n=1 Tax=Pseudopedobacter beijingensis TaxID=1207056 RepID=A0ABW4IBT7_9SPHI
MEFKIAGFNGKTILGDITRAKEENNIYAVFVHGFKGFKDWGAHNLVGSYFADQGVHYVKFNFSHSGVPIENPVDVSNLEDFANNTPIKELYDLDKVLHYVKSDLKAAKIILIGHSRGGGISILQTAKDQRVDGLITWAAISDFASLWKKEQEQEWEQKGKIETFNARTKEYMPLNVVLLHDYLQHAKELNIITAASGVKQPWLIIHGDNDINVNVSVAKQFHQINPVSELEIIPAANHVFGAYHPYKEDMLPKELLDICKMSIRFINDLT